MLYFAERCNNYCSHDCSYFIVLMYDIDITNTKTSHVWTINLYLGYPHMIF